MQVSVSPKAAAAIGTFHLEPVEYTGVPVKLDEGESLGRGCETMDKIFFEKICS